MATGARPPLLPPLLACLTLGLAPFAPLPHVVEKLQWLARGHPFRPIDVFDLLLHGSPWAWLGLALLRRVSPFAPAPSRPGPGPRGDAGSS